MTTVYGIKNCDTMKRALAWLKNNGIPCDFHDYKKSGIDTETLKSWSTEVGWKTFLNTRGTTWRKLADQQRADMDESKALQLMNQQPSLIKRPVLAHGETLLVGFDAAAYGRLFGK